MDWPTYLLLPCFQTEPNTKDLTELPLAVDADHQNNIPPCSEVSENWVKQIGLGFKIDKACLNLAATWSYTTQNQH
jgi:hypothetical protein